MTNNEELWPFLAFSTVGLLCSLPFYIVQKYRVKDKYKVDKMEVLSKGIKDSENSKGGGWKYPY